MEASPSPVYGARLLSGLRVKPLAGSNPAASAARSPQPCAGASEKAQYLAEYATVAGLHTSALQICEPRKCSQLGSARATLKARGSFRGPYEPGI